MSDFDVDRHLRAKIAELTEECKVLRAQLGNTHRALVLEAQQKTPLTVRAASDGWGAVDADGNNVGGGCSIEGWLRAVRWTERQHEIGVCAKCLLPPGCPDCRAVHDVPIGA